MPGIKDWKDGDPLRFELNLNVLHHLGVQLYASTPSVVTEIVANAWDADASNVDIVIEKDVIVVADDGHGMTRRDVQKRFLNVGYNRREFDKSGKSQNGKRAVMGRKGIGKLALFSIARMIEVTTQSSGQAAVQFLIDVDALIAAAKNDETYAPLEIKNPPNLPKGQGTIIRLSKLNVSANRTESYLRPRLARRFGIIGPAYEFAVSIGGNPITKMDSKLFDDLQFLWFLDDKSKEKALASAPNIATLPGDGDTPNQCVAKINDQIELDGHRVVQITGYIGAVDKPSKLGKEDESINQIALFSHGRLFQEDMLSYIGNAGVFNTYLVGEVHADFLDDDDIDRATSSREAVKRDDPLVGLVFSHVKDVLRTIRDQWDEWRVAIKIEEPGDLGATLSKWLESMPEERDRKQAKKLLKSIENVNFSSVESKNVEARKMLYKSAIVGFEKLRVKKNLDALEKITDVFSPEFQAIFTNIDDVEETYFHDISTQRLDVISKFEQYVDTNELEKVVQNYLLDHLWLLDPTWDRIGGTQQKEITLTDYLKVKCPDTEDGARIDIAYRMHTGKNVVVELKRPGIKPSFSKISDQCDKYRLAVESYAKQHSTFIEGGALGDLVIYFLLSDRSHIDSKQEIALSALGVKIVTYRTMIMSAKAAYEAYFHSRSAVGKLQKILSEI